jgi:hypothetical protein
MEKQFDQAWLRVRSLTIAYRSVGLTLEQSYFLRKGIDYLGQAEDYFTRNCGYPSYPGADFCSSNCEQEFSYNETEGEVYGG